MTWIAQQDTNGSLIAPPANVAPGVSEYVAAQAMNWQPDTWRVITQQEAEELQRPSRRDEMLTEIAAIEATQTLRMKRGAILGNQEDIDRLQAIEDKIEELRQQL